MLSAAGRFLGKPINTLSAGGNMAAGIFMMLVSLVVCYEAFMRYIVDKPTTWAMSLSLFVFMWFPFLSSPYGIQIGKHVSCDIFVSKFPKTPREWLGIFTDITSLIYIVGPKQDRNLYVDCSLAACYFMFCAAARGLGTCWVGLGTSILDPDLLDLMGIPEDHKIVAPLILGYPKGIPDIPKRNEPQILKILT